MHDEIFELQNELEQLGCDWADAPELEQKEIIQRAQNIRSRISYLKEAQNPQRILDYVEWNCDSWGRLVPQFPKKPENWR